MRSCTTPCGIPSQFLGFATLVVFVTSVIGLLDPTFFMFLSKVSPFNGAQRDSLATSTHVVNISKNREGQAEGEDSNIHSEPTSVSRPIILTEKLGAVNPSRIGAHNDPDQDVSSIPT
jgi:hypothetical protein